ncbi:type I-E CRISPR-associated protein Cas6/Cse3/CasE [Methanosarcina sp. WWM596]|uniref:type I-E CRISPR-associated protein Cas6/Cse3/CasE n=1 Tax=Methanosarcina sp. WWM596 TaxID=1434103 RepID=UPI0006158D42|nr:type I-E CRISPR-associated protein Cas6/Cse3/CasE [Methanosarcina sp. WWM596]AKB19755.1 CRISPR-associated protein, Cse3 family [Methanosarcina sp. WWM596]
MYISRANLKPDVATNKKFWTLSRNFGDIYKVHRVIWSFFANAPDKQRDFLYRQDEKNGFPLFYIVSEQEPDANIDLWQIESKEYKPLLSVGQKLIFSLRANPIVTRWNEKGEHKRHDIVMDAKNKMKKEGVPKDERLKIPEIVQEEGFEWLRKKGISNGFDVEKGQVISTGYRCNRFYKPKGKNNGFEGKYDESERKYLEPKRKHSVNISTIDFSGVLTVTDPECLTNVLYKGIGPAKSFGCGLMLIRPVR